MDKNKKRKLRKEYFKIVSDKEILDIIKANPNITVVELTKKLGYSNCTTHQRIDKLVERGLVKKTVINASFLKAIDEA